MSAFILVIMLGMVFSAPVAGEVVRIGGAGSTVGVMKLLAEAFEKMNPGIRVKVLPSMGSSGAVRAVAEGAIDMGITSRPLREAERRQRLSAIEVARTPFMIVTRHDVPISDMNSPELAKIYRGDRVRWPDGRQIRPVLRPATDTDTEYIKGISPEMDRAVDAALSRPGMLVAVTDQEAATLIERTPGSLGFLTLAQVITERRRVKILSYRGAAPSIKAISNGSYGLVKRFYMVTKRSPSDAARKFLHFVQSPGGAKILEKSGSLAMRGRGRASG